ncbi:uncharacterized protein LOC111028907 [Myzus persicae]|uniref:uncharacterized protein LOC111028907 n=1 Tax=Myzus persicae TaxID=13164 RepID=UPI000B936C58|nr:uncharacterized protein LOC111028907 [Myzus persicae]
MEYDVMQTSENPPSQHMRSPLSPGDSPGPKKLKASPDPAPVARETIKWIRYTLEMAATKKTSMPVETQRIMFEKLKSLDAAVHDMVVSNLQLTSQLEEARRSSEICVGAAVAQFGTELRLREAAHEQTLEAVITRYAEKEATRTLEAAQFTQDVPVEKTSTDGAPTFAVVTRRNLKKSTDRIADRSRSSATTRNKKLKETRQAEHLPSFTLNEAPGKTNTEVRDLIWNQVVAKNSKPKCHTIITRTGKTILKPSDKETMDVLKHLSKVSTLLKEDSLRWPRVTIRGVSSDTRFDSQTQHEILAQNPELGIDETVDSVVIKPVFKSGPRDRDTTNWIVEVNPKHYGKFENATLFIGLMRCRASAYEEVTQCHLCLRYGHPASKCQEKECVCAHCGRKGHKAADCPAAEADPTCTNCRGKHSARDKTCSSRTAYLLNQARRTDYGVAQ